MALTSGVVLEISATPFDCLPPRWQQENLASAAGALHAARAATDRGLTGERLLEVTAAAVHDQWLTRNEDRAVTTLRVPYAELTPEEQDKDRAVALMALNHLGHLSAVAAP